VAARSALRDANGQVATLRAAADASADAAVTSRGDLALEEGLKFENATLRGTVEALEASLRAREEELRGEGVERALVEAAIERAQKRSEGKEAEAASLRKERDGFASVASEAKRREAALVAEVASLRAFVAAAEVERERSRALMARALEDFKTGGGGGDVAAGDGLRDKAGLDDVEGGGASARHRALEESFLIRIREVRGGGGC
jgi:predicted GNAT family acetyltransferase